MPHYYLHLNECGDVTGDSEGIEACGLTAIRAEAIRAAREIMCAELAVGRLCLSCQIDIADGVGLIVMSVPFRNAVRITGTMAA